MFIRSERLFLRPAFPEDCEAILAGINDEAVVRNLARAPWPYGIDDARAFAALPQDMRLPHFLVTLPGVGVIGSAGMGEHEGLPEIGYWIARDHWGLGYASEAAWTALRCGFDRLSLDQVVAFTAVDNLPSEKVMQAIGMKHDPAGDFDHPTLAPDHPLSRHLLYRISREQWLKTMHG